MQSVLAWEIKHLKMSYKDKVFKDSSLAILEYIRRNKSSLGKERGHRIQKNNYQKGGEKKFECIRF